VDVRAAGPYCRCWQNGSVSDIFDKDFLKIGKSTDSGVLWGKVDNTARYIVDL
jgi:hypothetical protein